ncbi:putative peptidase [Burkholderiales bacterium]|nr:putative peptidase [Burkholderiales bacterium]
MKPLRSELELLAPAADADIGIEAVNHGADAVYIGGPAFGARAHAANEVSDIERLVRHAHRYGARVFVTLNTILRDDELEPARRLVTELYRAGVDALIVQDMGLLELDLPPLQLHASTQCDIRTPQKARFLQDVGFSQLVLARELSLPQLRAIAEQVREACLEFFIHGALCVAYSGQCYVSHAQTGRSANRGDCSQACRLPYTLADAQGRIVAHEKHLLSMKDNDQSDNLAALIDAGIRSFKIEGRYKDLGYVKNVTAHYRRRLDAILESRSDLRAASSGKCQFHFVPDPARNFHRGRTDYFVDGRGGDIGAFDSPKYAGIPIGHVARVADGFFDVAVDEGVGPLHNGDGLTYFDRQQQLVGVLVNLARLLAPAAAAPAGGERTPQSIWRIEPNEPIGDLRDLRPDAPIARNRDMGWNRTLAGKTAERRIGVDWRLGEEAGSLLLCVADREGHSVTVPAPQDFAAAQNIERAGESMSECLAKLGGTIFRAGRIDLAWKTPRFIAAREANAWRREAIAQLERLRLHRLPRLPRRAPAQPAAAYPGESLSYLGNVANQRAAAFYARHGVQLVEAGYECHRELGDVSLMITKHCVRYSLSLCPKQAKGVTGVQGTIRAEPLTLINGKERLALHFDCKACEMHVVGRIKPGVLAAVAAVPVAFPAYRRERQQLG